MLKKIFKSQKHILFWIIYIGYSHVYEAIAYPDDSFPLIVWLVHYGSFVLVFYCFYLSMKLYFFYNKRIKIEVILLFVTGFICVYGLQSIKYYYIFDLKSVYFGHYITLFGEVFLIITIGIFFALIEQKEILHRLNYSNLLATNEKILFLNENKRNKKILINLFDKIGLENGPEKINLEFKKFRELMDFLINNTHKSLIQISSEIENLHRYINLYKLRSGNVDTFQLKITGELLDWQIPHKTILTLVENTIKHGDLNEAVTINIISQPTYLKIEVKNKISTQPSAIESTNIGLTNLMARFELHLKNRHKIVFVKEDSFHEVLIWVFLKHYQQ